MHLAPLIRDLAVILTVAGLVSLLFQKIRQPVVLGYIIAGAIVGPYTPPYALVSDLEGIKIWAELGIIFLMFCLGLEFSFRKLASVGLPAGFTACFEVFFMLSLGFGSGKWLGWSSTDSLFLGAMLSISSTTIIIKALTDLNMKNNRFAEFIFAILIVEDLVAILVLVALSSIAINRSVSGLALLGSAYKLCLVVGSWFLGGYFIVPRFIRYVGRVGNNEMLTIVSLGLCLALVVFSTFFEYSAALGAFIMGSILAESVESHRIEERMESLRDLFAAIFFVSVGMLIDPIAIWDHKGAVVLITVVTILGKSISTTLGALFTGQSLKTSVQVGLGLAQIGEFSFIIASLGTSLGVTSDFLYPVGVAVSLITTFTTPYMIRASYQLATLFDEKIPNGIKSLLNQYSNWSFKQQADSSKNAEFYQGIFKWLINAFIVSVIFIISGEFLLPWIQEMITSSFLAGATGWLITVFLSMPFIWAMLSIFKTPIFSKKRRFFASTPLIGANFIFEISSLLWLGTLSLQFLQAKHVTFIFGTLALGVFTLFYKRIEPYYRWFEKKFVFTFEMKEKVSTTVRENLYQNLAPWDAHLIRLKVHPNAKLVGTRIGEAQLRTRFGVGVVAIQRGLKTIVAPKPEELILPQDELLVLATDTQLEGIRPEIERPPTLAYLPDHLSTYDLKQIFITQNSPLVQATIRESKMREEFGVLVVGIEREASRIVNPESDITIEKGDTLWIVGEKVMIDKLGKWASGMHSLVVQDKATS